VLLHQRVSGFRGAGVDDNTVPSRTAGILVNGMWWLHQVSGRAVDWRAPAPDTAVRQRVFALAVTAAQQRSETSRVYSTLHNS
jgi:hypothetical protein